MPYPVPVIARRSGVFGRCGVVLPDLRSLCWCTTQGAGFERAGSSSGASTSGGWSAARKTESRVSYGGAGAPGRVWQERRASTPVQHQQEAEPRMQSHTMWGHISPPGVCLPPLLSVCIDGRFLTRTAAQGRSAHRDEELIHPHPVAVQLLRAGGSRSSYSQTLHAPPPEPRI